MDHIDIRYRVRGDSLRIDHGYDLYAALSRVLPWIHEPTGTAAEVRIGPVRGVFVGNDRLRLPRGESQLRLRVPLEGGWIQKSLPLAGRRLDLNGDWLRVGVPAIGALVPTPSLTAHFCTIKGFLDPEPFLQAVARQLAGHGIAADAEVPLLTRGPNAGRFDRRVMTVHGTKIVGFRLNVHLHDPADAPKLQTVGIGGRLKMGAGFFLPLREDEG